MEAKILQPIGPYSNPGRLAKPDGRTREGKLAAATRAELTAHVGGAPSATQRALIERAVQLTLRLAMMDEDFAATGVMPDHVARSYLAWSNTLARTLTGLGMKAASPSPRSLQQHMAARSAA